MCGEFDFDSCKIPRIQEKLCIDAKITYFGLKMTLFLMFILNIRKSVVFKKIRFWVKISIFEQDIHKKYFHSLFYLPAIHLTLQRTKVICFVWTYVNYEFLQDRHFMQLFIGAFFFFFAGYYPINKSTLLKRCLPLWQGSCVHRCIGISIIQQYTTSANGGTAVWN